MNKRIVEDIKMDIIQMVDYEPMLNKEITIDRVNQFLESYPDYELLNIVDYLTHVHVYYVKYKSKD